jgi:copper(I)-binding protein
MKKISPTTAFAAAVTAAFLGSAAWAQTATVKVENAWARASVQGQKASGAFMRLTSPDGARLVRAESPAAGVTEVHEMKMEGDVMKMRPVPALDLPAGQAVELKPGGYHVMLLDLKAPLKKGSTVPVTLYFQDAKGAESRLDLSLPVGTAAPGAAAPAQGAGHGHKH